MADTWPVSGGAVGTKNSANKFNPRDAEQFVSGDESISTTTKRASYPFVHPDDKIKANGIWTFLTRQQAKEFVKSKKKPFDNPEGRPENDAVVVRINSAGGRIYIVLLQQFADDPKTWADYPLAKMIRYKDDAIRDAENNELPGTFQTEALQGLDEIKALNNIIRTPPILNTQTDILRGADGDQIPNATNDISLDPYAEERFTANLVAQPNTVDDKEKNNLDKDTITKAGPATGTTTKQGYIISDANGGLSTAIQDVLGNIINQTADSFLQSLPGSLSQIIGGAVKSLSGLLGGVMQNLLSSTALTSTLGDVIGSVSGAIGNAVGEVAGALTDVAGTLFTGLGNVISEIPGMAPIVQDFSSAVKGLGNTISTAYKGLDPVLKTAVDASIAGVGAKLLDKAGLPSINPGTAAAIAGTISFVNNPASGFGALASTSRAMDEKIFEKTGNSTFGNLAAKADFAAKEFEKVLTVDNTGSFILSNTPAKLIDEVRSVTNSTLGDVLPNDVIRAFTGTIFSNERVKNINGKTYVVPR